MKNGFSLSILLLLIPSICLAHGSHGSGIMAGFTHPIFGFDHNLAIAGLTILGAIIDKKKWYLYPLSFLALMIVGGILGVGKEATALIEKIIAASVLLIGVQISFDLLKSKAIILVLLTIFGFFHGFAHGAEMPETTTVAKYVIGYSLGTLLIALVSFLFVRVLSNVKTAGVIYKGIGGFLIGAGLVFLIS